MSTDSSCWHKCTIGADRGGEIFDMLPRRGVEPVVPVPESAVDQLAGLSGARPQSGFAGKVSVLRMPLSSCPGLWPPSAASSGLMHSHQHLLSGGACLYLVARPAHHDRHFLKTEPAPFTLHAFLLLSPFRGPRSRPQTPTAIGAYGNWPEHAHVGVWLRWVVFFWCGRGGKQGPRGMPRGCFQDARPLPPL